jgi:hypothetical protein
MAKCGPESRRGAKSHIPIIPFIRTYVTVAGASMFCPHCEAEYLPHIRRCSDCDVPLVEQLHVSHHHSERERNSGSSFFTRNGTLIVLPISILAMMLLIVALRNNPFAIPIAEVFWGTSFAFLSVFCDMGPGKWGVGKGTKGYSLGEKAVREKLPLFLRIHAGVLLFIVAGMIGAFWLRRHTLFVWNIDTPYFDLTLVLIALAPQIAEAQFFRRLLGRALKDEQRESHS